VIEKTKIPRCTIAASALMRKMRIRPLRIHRECLE